MAWAQVTVTVKVLHAVLECCTARHAALLDLAAREPDLLPKVVSFLSSALPQPLTKTTSLPGMPFREGQLDFTSVTTCSRDDATPTSSNTSIHNAPLRLPNLRQPPEPDERTIGGTLVVDKCAGNSLDGSAVVSLPNADCNKRKLAVSGVVAGAMEESAARKSRRAEALEVFAATVASEYGSQRVLYELECCLRLKRENSVPRNHPPGVPPQRLE